MIGNIMMGLLLIITIVRFYKNRRVFKKLSKKEWFHYGVGFLSAWAVAALVIMGGIHLTDAIQITWLRKILEILLIVVGLAFAGFIMHKALPEKLREFYS